VADERLLATRQRVLARLQAGVPDRQLLDQLLDQLARRPAVAGAVPPPAWITASNGRETRLVMLEDVLYFRADSKYTAVVTADEELLLRSSLRELAQVLDPQCFRQVHRSSIVNMKAVAAVSRDDSGRGVLRLKNRSETLVVSQPFMSLFRGM
jgi:DNA-binding LytR/AlgR family response regulator